MTAAQTHEITVAIIGAGASGREFAVACAAAGFRVVLEDVMPEKLRNAAATFAQVGGQVSFVTSVEDAVRAADLVIDFVPDELESKLEIWSLIDRMAPPHTVMCTLSEALSITDLASCTYRADRCVMLRGSVVAGESVRILSASGTSVATIELTTVLVNALGCRALQEHDPDLPMLLKNMNAGSLV